MVSVYTPPTPILTCGRFLRRLARPVTAGVYADAIAAISRCRKPVLAIDIPSGLSADTGQIMGSAVAADATVTFIGLKQGLLTGAAVDHVGALHYAGLGVEQVRVPWCACMHAY